MGIGWLGRLDTDPGVDHVRAVRAGDHGVEVELGDLREVVGEPRYAHQDVLQRGDVDGGGTAVAEQQRGGADGADQRGGVGERGEPGGLVAEHVGGDAAEAEDHRRAEHRFLHHADDHLGAAAIIGWMMAADIPVPNLSASAR